MASDACGTEPEDVDAIGRRALAEVERLLGEKPDKVGHDFSQATRCLASYRDELIGRWRGTGTEDDHRRLEQINTVLSAVMGGHFPIGNVPWDQIKRARDVLAGTLGEGTTPMNPPPVAALANADRQPRSGAGNRSRRGR